MEGVAGFAPELLFEEIDVPAPIFACPFADYQMGGKRGIKGLAGGTVGSQNRPFLRLSDFFDAISHQRVALYGDPGCAAGFNIKRMVYCCLPDGPWQSFVLGWFHRFKTVAELEFCSRPPKFMELWFPKLITQTVFVPKSREIEVCGVLLVTKGKHEINKRGHYLVVSECRREHVSGGVEGISGVVCAEEAGDS